MHSVLATISSSHLTCLVWLEVLSKGIEGKLEGIPYFIAEVSVPNNPLHVQVDVTPLGRVGAKGKAHCVCATLWNAIRIVSFLQEMRVIILIPICTLT